MLVEATSAPKSLELLSCRTEAWVNQNKRLGLCWILSPACSDCTFAAQWQFVTESNSSGMCLFALGNLHQGTSGSTPV